MVMLGPGAAPFVVVMPKGGHRRVGARSAEEGLALLDEGDAAGYPYLHLVRGALLEELGRDEAAIDALERAAREAGNAHEARQIQQRISRVRERVGT